MARIPIRFKNNPNLGKAGKFGAGVLGLEQYLPVRSLSHSFSFALEEGLASDLHRRCRRTASRGRYFRVSAGAWEDAEAPAGGVHSSGDDSTPGRQRDGGQQAHHGVRSGGANAVSVRAGGEGQGPPVQGLLRELRRVRGSEAGQPQGLDAARGEEGEPGVEPGLLILQGPSGGGVGGGGGQGQGLAQGRLDRQGRVRASRGAPAGAPGQPAGAAVVPAGRQQGQPRQGRDHAGRVDGHAGGRGLPGGLAFRRRPRHKIQGLPLAETLVPAGQRHRGAGPGALGQARPVPRAARQGRAGEPRGSDPGLPAWRGQPAVERGPHVRRRRALRGAPGPDRGGEAARQGAGAGQGGDPAVGGGAAARRQAGGLAVGAAGGRGIEQGEEAPEPGAPPGLPRGRVPRPGRVHPLQQRSEGDGEAAVAAADRGAGAGHPRRAGAAVAQDQGRPRLQRRLLRGQVRAEVGAHPDRRGLLEPALERAVPLGGLRPLHRGHRRGVRQRQPARRRRRAARGQGPDPALHPGDGPRLRPLVPAAGPAPVRGEEDGELQLAVRFACSSLANMLHIYSQPLLPKMHYLHPLSVAQLDMLRNQATQIVAARLGRAEPPLRKEVVEYMLDVDLHMWSMRRSKANFFRIMGVFGGAAAAARWLDQICRWRNPVATVLIHLLFAILVLYPELILPTVFLYMVLIGVWRFRRRPRQPPHMDARLSHADHVHPDELDEEFDTFPSSRPPEVVRMRYDRLRSVAGRVQTVVGDLATQGERLQALLSWRDPRATALFVVFCLLAAAVLYVVPFQLVALLAGFYVLRHPRFRHDLPSVPLNFFRRLPARTDSML